MFNERPSGLVPPRDPNGNKGTFGKVLILAGRKNMCGAALLAAQACMASGAGMVKIFTHEANRLIVQQSLPEALLDTYEDSEAPGELREKLLDSLKWADVAAAGPAMGTGSVSRLLLKTVLEYTADGPLRGLVLDADALRMLADDGSFGKLLAGRRESLPCVLTPHLAEFAALAGCGIRECILRRAELVPQQADLLRCTVACKDARTLVASAQNSLLYLNSSGNSGMAAAGSGDVLTGMTAAMLALFSGSGSSGSSFFTEHDRVSGFEAACCAVYLHGLAGDLAARLHGEQGMTARDLIEALRSPSFYTDTNISGISRYCRA